MSGLHRVLPVMPHVHPARRLSARGLGRHKTRRAGLQTECGCDPGRSAGERMRERTAVLAIDLARHAKLLFDERELLGVILVLLIPRRPDASQRRQMATAALESGSPDLLERSEEPTSELQSLMRISYAVFCLKIKNTHYKYTVYKTQT